jgi:hypothetical protein
VEANLADVQFRIPPVKLFLLHRLFDGYSIAWDVAVAIGLLWLLVRTYRDGGLVGHPDMKAPLLTLAAIYMVLPSEMFHGTNADYRLLMPMAMFAAAVMRNPFRERRQQLRAATALVALIAAKAAIVTSAWRDSERVYRDFHQVIAEVPEGARLTAFAVGGTYGDAIFPTSVIHLGGFAVVERKAFVPMLFANPFDQPLSYTPRYAAVRTGLATGFFDGSDDVPWMKIDDEYDYLVLMRPPGSPDPRAVADGRTRSRAVSQQGWFVLYRTPRAVPSPDGQQAGDGNP